MSSKRITRQKSPYKRAYMLGTCFLCQKCLSCQKQLSTRKCNCDLTKKPPFRNSNNSRNYYSRVYNPNTINRIYISSQINKINNANETFSYNLDFSTKFSYSLCVLCHNLMARLRKRNDEKKIHQRKHQRKI